MGPQKRNTNKNMLFVVVVLLFGIDVAFSQLDLCARRSFDKCELFPGDSFDGAFPNNDLENLSGKKFTLTIAQDNYGIIASEHSTVFTKLAWAEELIDGRIVDTLTITDQVGLPDAHACIDSDGNAEVGKYELSWHKNCLLATLTRIGKNRAVAQPTASVRSKSAPCGPARTATHANGLCLAATTRTSRPPLPPTARAPRTLVASRSTTNARNTRRRRPRTTMTPNSRTKSRLATRCSA